MVEEVDLEVEEVADLEADLEVEEAVVLEVIEVDVAEVDSVEAVEIEVDEAEEDSAMSTVPQFLPIREELWPILVQQRRRSLTERLQLESL